jgi:hypothetical protein
LRDIYTEEPPSPEDSTYDVLKFIPKRVSMEDNSSLTTSISEKEINKAITNMEPDKAPGPDGFTVGFIKVC